METASLGYRVSTAREQNRHPRVAQQVSEAWAWWHDRPAETFNRHWQRPRRFYPWDGSATTRRTTRDRQ